MTVNIENLFVRILVARPDATPDDVRRLAPTLAHLPDAEITARIAKAQRRKERETPTAQEKMTERKMDLNDLLEQHQLALHRLTTARSADTLQAAAFAADGYARLIARKRRAFAGRRAVISRDTYCALVRMDH